ncbi:hypothetical protein [Flavobacterium sp. FlaQc-50]|jgi:hypothetical protein|uniref:hypothetical protein n=1 Tax=unclassified Flavobacterium TaxID=196869 RepID=UPI003756EE8A
MSDKPTDSSEIKNTDPKPVQEEKTNLISHLAIRLGIPFFIIFLIAVSMTDARDEKAIFLAWTTTVFLLLLLIFLAKETSRFTNKKQTLLKNVNIFLLLLYIFLFVISGLFTLFIGGYN